jgi:capsule biosynthesis phosphatase
MRIAVDLDGTICSLKKQGQSYADVEPNFLAVERLRQLKAAGHQIIILTARHMKTCNGDVAEVISKIGEITLAWLKKYQIPYDEIHFGKPYADVYLDDLGERFGGWEKLTPEYLNHSSVNILIPMAGAGSRFAKAGFKDPKPLIKVKGEPMIKWAMKSFDFLHKISALKLIFVVLQEHEERYGLAERLRDIFGREIEVITSPSVTGGQAETCLLAKNLIDNYNKLFIYNCDTYSLSDIWDLIEAEDPDGILSCFKANHPRYSYAKLDEFGHVCETAEKRVISDLATTGLYYFRRGLDFVHAAETALKNHQTENGEFYVAPLYNSLIAAGKKIRICETKTNWVFGTPEELEFFEKNFK